MDEGTKVKLYQYKRIIVMVSNIQIDSVLGGVANYSGCFSLDEIDLIKPSTLKDPSSFVLNTFERRFSQGGHWLLVTFFKDKSEVEIFDSLGMPSLIPSRIGNTLLHFGNLIHTTKLLQNPLSDCCGLYVIGRSISINRGQSLKRFLDNFGQDNHKNDTLMNRVVAQYLNGNISES